MATMPQGPASARAAMRAVDVVCLEAPSAGSARHPARLSVVVNAARRLM
jgi:hypothetical protein